MMGSLVEVAWAVDGVGVLEMGFPVRESMACRRMVWSKIKTLEPPVL